MKLNKGKKRKTVTKGEENRRISHFLNIWDVDYTRSGQQQEAEGNLYARVKPGNDCI